MKAKELPKKKKFLLRDEDEELRGAASAFNAQLQGSESVYGHAHKIPIAKGISARN